MEAVYEREGFHQFMMLQVDGSRHDVNMLAQNQLKGILPHEVRWMNGKTYLCYRIEGCQPFTRVFGQTQLSQVQVRQMYRHIYEVLEELREYLFSYDSLVLEPEHLYWSWAEQRLYFAINPMQEEDIADQLMVLTEYFMQELHYADAGSAEAVYQLYDQLRKQGASGEVLLSWCEKPVSSRVERQCPGESQTDSGQDMKAMQEMYAMTENPWIRRLTDWIDGLRRKWLAPEWIADAPSSVAERESTQMGEGQAGGEQTGEAQAVAGQEQPESSGETVLLSGTQKQGMYLVALERTSMDIQVMPGAGLLGRHEESCRYLVNETGVSRIHAQLEAAEGSLYVTDLHSSNGTFVNGQRIAVQEAVRLEDGDVVQFGTAKYRISQT